MTQLNNTALIFIGSTVVVIVGALVKQWFTRFVNKKFDDLHAFQLSGKKESEYDEYLAFRGQQVICTCLHELIYAVLNGHHNGELEIANAQLNTFRELLDKNVAEKASRWDIQIKK